MQLSIYYKKKLYLSYFVVRVLWLEHLFSYILITLIILF